MRIQRHTCSTLLSVMALACYPAFAGSDTSTNSDADAAQAIEQQNSYISATDTGEISYPGRAGVGQNKFDYSVKKVVPATPGNGGAGAGTAGNGKEVAIPPGNVPPAVPKKQVLAGRTVTTHDGGKTYVFSNGGKDIIITPKDHADLLDQIRKYNAGVYEPSVAAITLFGRNMHLSAGVIYYKDLLAGKYDAEPWAAQEKLVAESKIAAFTNEIAANDAYIFDTVGTYKGDWRTGKPIDITDYGNPSRVVKQLDHKSTTMFNGSSFDLIGRSVTTYDNGETYVLYVNGQHIKLKTKVDNESGASLKDQLKEELQAFNLANAASLNISGDIKAMEDKINAANTLLPFLKQVQTGQWDAHAANDSPVMGKPLSEWKAQIAAGKISELQAQINTLQPQVDSYYDDLFGKGKRP